MKCACKSSSENKVVGLPDHFEPRFLLGLPETEVTSILSVAKHRHFRASSVITNQGDAAERLFLLTSGHGRHFVITHEGRRILGPWLTAGQIFGGATLLPTSHHYLASMELLEDSCVFVWERQVIRSLVSRYPQLMENAFSIAVTEHITWLAAAHVSLSSDDAHGRIAHLLLSLASGIGKPTADGVEMQITNEDVAGGANVTPFTVSRSLSDWERSGVLKKRRGKIVLRRPELLLTAS
jgi:CRP/FNR family transcriptional regulator, nitrogen oxide reductase regulator